MRHYVLTRSAYGPVWDIEANRRRLLVTQAVTARLMAAQTSRDWSWVVVLDPRDPLLAEREAVFRAAAPEFIPLYWMHPEEMARVPWDPEPKRKVSESELIAAAAYRAPWRSVMVKGEAIFQTRLDDDDGLRPDAIARYQRLWGVKRRAILMLPKGVRVYEGRYSDITHNRNAMHTLATTAGDNLCIYDYGHTRSRGIAPVVDIDREWGWIWVRHRDTLSGWRETHRAIDRRVREAFPVDWAALEASWS